jgi:hypothetical protein
MELEQFKSAWQSQPVEGHSLPSPVRISQSLQFLRTSVIRDLQRSDELSRLIFSFLFALVVVGVSFVLMTPGAGRKAAWLFATALLVDGVAGVALLARRFREPPTATLLDFIRREHRQVETRLRFERYSQRLMFLLAAAALLLLIFSPTPLNLRENLFDPFGRMVVVTGFLALAWRKAKSRSREIRREIERYLKDLES